MPYPQTGRYILMSKDQIDGRIEGGRGEARRTRRDRPRRRARAIHEKERKEAERKIIEAQAKADANRILSASITDRILRDKGIEATLELAQSPNSKVVIVGGGDEGLPLILNN